MPTGNHAIIQMVSRKAMLERSGKSPIATHEVFYELWDVVVDTKGNVTMMAPFDSFAWHDQAGDATKGHWDITGLARFVPFLDVLAAKAAGEPWQQGVIKGVGKILFTLTQEPKKWKHHTSEVARRLNATWKCFPKEGSQPTDITGSGPIAP
jgi:hypothetical protein